MNRAQCKWFSLVELLIVVAVLAIMISLLQPSLLRSMEIARRTKCASQQQHIGAAFIMYTEDHDGYHVAGTGTPSPERFPLPSASWEAPISIYLGIDWPTFDYGGQTLFRSNDVAQPYRHGHLNSDILAIFACPSDAAEIIWDNVIKKSYGVNMMSPPRFSDYSSYGVVSLLEAGGDFQHTMETAVHESEIPLPSNTIISGDSWGEDSSGIEYTNECGGRIDHNVINANAIRQNLSNVVSRPKYNVHEGIGLSNFLFADGHVTSMLYMEVVSQNGASHDATESMLSRDQ